MTADGPGQTTISDPKDTTSLTNKDPGSEIKGVPASETKAKSFPEDNFKIAKSPSYPDNVTENPADLASFAIGLHFRLKARPSVD